MKLTENEALAKRPDLVERARDLFERGAQAVWFGKPKSLDGVLVLIEEGERVYLFPEAA